MNPVSASLPVIAMSRSAPTAARIASHSAAVRWSFHRIAGRRTSIGRVEQDERRASGRSARSPSTSPPDRRPVVASTAPIAATAPVHHSAGSCSLQSGCGCSNAVLGRRRRRGRRPVSSTRTALVAVVETSIPRTSAHGQRPAPVSIGARSAAQIRWLTRFSSSSWWPDTRTRVDLARRDLRLERRERSRRRRGSPRRAGRSSPRSAPRASRERPASRPGPPRRAAPARACRCRRCGRGTGPIRSMLWRRSFASKLKPPVVNPPPLAGSRTAAAPGPRPSSGTGRCPSRSAGRRGWRRCCRASRSRRRRPPRGGSCGRRASRGSPRCSAWYSSSSPLRTRKPWTVAES